MKNINLVEVLTLVYGKESVAKSRKTVIMKSLWGYADANKRFMVTEAEAVTVLQYIADGKSEYRDKAKEVIDKNLYANCKTPYEKKTKGQTISSLRKENEYLKALLDNAGIKY